MAKVNFISHGAVLKLFGDLGVRVRGRLSMHTNNATHHPDPMIRYTSSAKACAVSLVLEDLEQIFAEFEEKHSVRAGDG